MKQLMQSLVSRFTRRENRRVNIYSRRLHFILNETVERVDVTITADPQDIPAFRYRVRLLNQDMEIWLLSDNLDLTLRGMFAVKGFGVSQKEATGYDDLPSAAIHIDDWVFGLVKDCYFNSDFIPSKQRTVLSAHHIED